MPKRLALFFDGTWSRADQVNTTNVTKAHKATVRGTANGMEQVPFYDEGVGSRGTGSNPSWAACRAPDWSRTFRTGTGS